MHRSVFIRWVAAALVALVTAVVVASDLAELHRRARTLGPERTVVVAPHDLPLGHIVSDDDLTTRTVHESQLPQGTATEIDEVRSRVVIAPLLEGTFVTPRHLAPAERTGLDGVVAVGDRALRVEPVSTPALRPGDVVDVLATFDRSETIEARVAAAGALVAGVDEHERGEATPGAAITLLVRDDEVERVAAAIVGGTVTLALVAPEEVAGRT